MGYLGIKIALKSKDDLFNISKLSRLSSTTKEKTSKKEGKNIFFFFLLNNHRINIEIKKWRD